MVIFVEFRSHEITDDRSSVSNSLNNSRLGFLICYRTVLGSTSCFVAIFHLQLVIKAGEYCFAFGNQTFLIDAAKQLVIDAAGAWYVCRNTNDHKTSILGALHQSVGQLLVCCLASYCLGVHVFMLKA